MLLRYASALIIDLDGEMRGFAYKITYYAHSTSVCCVCASCSCISISTWAYAYVSNICVRFNIIIFSSYALVISTFYVPNLFLLYARFVPLFFSCLNALSHLHPPPPTLIEFAAPVNYYQPNAIYIDDGII